MHLAIIQWTIAKMCLIICSFIQNTNDDVFKEQQKRSPNKSNPTGGTVQRDKITVWNVVITSGASSGNVVPVDPSTRRVSALSV
jgi:hypothetical protein